MNKSLRSLYQWIGPGWLDDARFITQKAALQETVHSHPRWERSCLNAGSGEGLFTPWLASCRGIHSVVHLDIHPAAVRPARLRQWAVSGSVSSLPFRDKSFDCCLCTEVLEHVPNDSEAISELARILKKGGNLVISVPCPPAPYDPHHVRQGYSLGQLSSFLLSRGLSVQNHRYCFYAPFTIAHALWQWQFRTLGRGRRSFFPRGLLFLLGFLDRYLQIGKPWNLMVMAEKTRD